MAKPKRVYFDMKRRRERTLPRPSSYAPLCTRYRRGIIATLSHQVSTLLQASKIRVKIFDGRARRHRRAAVCTPFERRHPKGPGTAVSHRPRPPWRTRGRESVGAGVQGRQTWCRVGSWCRVGGARRPRWCGQRSGPVFQGDHGRLEAPAAPKVALEPPP